MAFGAILSAAAPILGGFLSSKGQSSANDAARNAAEAQMAFQRESAQNSYQWAVKDMKRAGINPMLAYQQGGASALSGASYQPQNEFGAAGSAVRDSVTSGLAAKRQQQELRNLKAQEKVAEIEFFKKRDERTNTNADTQIKYVRAQREAAQLELDRQAIHSARAQASVAKADEEFYSKDFGKFLRWLNRAGVSANPFIDASGGIAGGGKRR